MSTTTFDFQRRKHDSLEELMLLASGLNSAEKTHVRQFFREKEEIDQLKLFQFILKCSDEKALSKKLDGLGNDPSSTAARKLTARYVQILQPLHARIDEENQMLQGLLELRFLADKKLFKLCLKRLRKLKQKAYDYQIYEVVLRLIKLQREITFFSSKEIEENNLLIAEAETVEKFIRNETAARSIANEVGNILYAAGLSAREKIVSDVLPFKSKLEGLMAQKELSLRAEVNLAKGLSNIAIVEKNYEQAFEPFPRLIKSFEANPFLKQARISQFIQIIVNFINRKVSSGKCTEIEDLKFIEEVIERTKSKAKLKEEEEQYLSATLYHARYAIYLGNWDLPNALKMAELMENCPIPLERNHALKAIFLYEFAQIHFYTGKLEACKAYIQLFLNEESKKHFPDLFLFSRILYLFVLTEEGNTMGFFNQYDATRKAVESAPHKVSYEKSIMKMLLHFNKAISVEKRLKALMLCLSEIKEIQEAEEGSFMFFRIERWLDTKILTLQQKQSSNKRKVV